MRLAFCLFHYFPYGGLQRDFMRIAELCHKKGHTIDVYTMRWKGEKPAWVNSILIKPNGLTNHARCHSFTQKLQSNLAEKKYDCIIGFNRMPNLDIYYAADVCFVAQQKYQKPFWKKWLPRYAIYAKLEHAIFNPSQHTQALLLTEKEKILYEKYYQTPKERLHILPPGIQKTCLRPKEYHTIRQTYRDNLSLSNNDFLILMIASHYHTKGLDRSMKAIAALPKNMRKKIKLIIVGEDSKAPYLHLANTLNITQHIKFLGSRDDVPALLFSADLLLHPARVENTGTVILEALTAGLPVLATDLCGYSPYITQAEGGDIIPIPFRQKTLNTLLNETLKHELLATYQANALKHSASADWFNSIERAVEIIENFKK